MAECLQRRRFDPGVVAEGGEVVIGNLVSEMVMTGRHYRVGLEHGVRGRAFECGCEFGVHLHQNPRSFQHQERRMAFD